ncbi:RagB/SusD family nutrient uptake outer membrane protein [Bacteroides sp. UBA939]|uniref:RagB/SusD family nutrient uptake outer membrane protein n=1 Tax=Bacteroides sp. UBA939 TaxID=1946092 RepID=UPI0025B8D04A|nr:RagB/SusD family nutrient uptake outer membrane protein [Bacteroides sp. UBA939]
MKKINIVCLLLLLVFTGCDSILDKGPLDTFSNSNFWTGEGNVSGYANSFYDSFSGYNDDFYFRTLSDDQTANSFVNWASTAIPASSGNWSSPYTNIRRANIMIEEVAEMSIPEARKNHWIGVARMMRAQYYYRLVRMFGDVPYTDKSLDITDEAVLYGPRNNRDEVMDHVLEDLNFACAHIDDVSSKITWSRNMAYAMKTEICLFEGTYRKYRKAEDYQTAPDMEGTKKYLKEAKDAAAYLIPKYSLNKDSYQTQYNSVSLSANSEIIFFKAYKQSILTHSLVAYTSASTPISGMSKDAFDSYLFTDGKPLALTSCDKSDLPKMIEKPTGPVFSITHLLAVRDKRLAQTIDSAVFYSGRTFTRFNVGMAMTSTSGYGVCKYDNETIPTNFRNQTGSNYTCAPLFWLATVYLQYAEAAAELADAGGEAITQADLDKTINLLKDRAGLPHLSLNVGFNDPANNHGVSSLLWEIRRERRCELMFDNWARYWDLIRWHQLDKLDTTTNPNIILGANVSADPDIASNEAVKLKGNYLDVSRDGRRTFDKRYYWYPIPSGQIILNPQLTQNRGWE